MLLGYMLDNKNMKQHNKFQSFVRKMNNHTLSCCTGWLLCPSRCQLLWSVFSSFPNTFHIRHVTDSK